MFIFDYDFNFIPFDSHKDKRNLNIMPNELEKVLVIRKINYESGYEVDFLISKWKYWESNAGDKYKVWECEVDDFVSYGSHVRFGGKYRVICWSKCPLNKIDEAFNFFEKRIDL